MNLGRWIILIAFWSVWPLVSCIQEKDVMKQEEDVIKNYADIQQVKEMLAQFTPVEISFDEAPLKEGDKRALLKLIEAAKIMDEIFLHQVYQKNVAIRKALSEGSNPDYPPLKDCFDIHFGPFDRLNHHQPFINLDQEKPKGANYYPMDFTREEFERWIEEHPEDKTSFTSNFTLIRREGDKLVAIPYSDAYRLYLEPAAELLKEAGQLTDNASLKKYLNTRAEAFLTNDYFESDMAWMDLSDHTLEVVIGPYEVYEDELFGYKAAFEAFITIVDPEHSKKLEMIGNFLNDLEKGLPIDERYKNFNRGALSPIVVVNEVFAAGDTKAGVQTAAFNLPNDERVREAKGSKKVMLKNVTRAKYEKTSIPIMQRILKETSLENVSFEAFFNHIVLHEMCHGIGPGAIIKEGEQTTVNKMLREHYSVLEEAKADVLGLYYFPLMIEKGVFEPELSDKFYPSFLGGIFRSVRFGISEAHGGANVIILNYLIEKGGVEFDPQTERFGVNFERIDDAVRELAREILMIQALGDYNGAQAFIEKYRYVSPELQKALDKLSDIPVDIRPIFTVETLLTEQAS